MTEWIMAFTLINTLLVSVAINRAGKAAEAVQQLKELKSFIEGRLK